MDKKHIVLALAVMVFAVPLTTSAKTAHRGSCDGEALDYNTARGACRSGDFAGETIVSCKSNGKETDRRLRNSDGKKNAIYEGNCGGTLVNHGTLSAACDSGDYPGELIVRCKRGREAKHRVCPTTVADDVDVSVHSEGSVFWGIGDAIKTMYPTVAAANVSYSRSLLTVI